MPPLLGLLVAYVCVRAIIYFFQIVRIEVLLRCGEARWNNLTEGQNSYFSCSHQASLAFALAKLPNRPRPPTSVVCLLAM